MTTRCCPSWLSHVVLLNCPWSLTVVICCLFHRIVWPHTRAEREKEFAMTVWGLIQGNVWVQISLCLTRNSRCFYITNCHVAGGQIKPRDGTVDPPPAWTDRLLAQADKPFAADLLIVIVGGLLVLWSDLHVQCHTLWSVLMDSKVNYRKVCASFV